MLHGLLKFITFIIGALVLKLPVDHYLLGNSYHTIVMVACLLTWAGIVQYNVTVCLNAGKTRKRKGNGCIRNRSYRSSNGHD